MQFLTFSKTAVIACFVITGIATPLPTTEELTAVYEALEKRLTVPTVEECKAQLNVAKDTTIFWSGPGDYQAVAKDLISKRPYLNGYQVLFDKFKDTAWRDQYANAGGQTTTDFFDVCSQALAEASSGTAYVVLPGDTTGTDWYPNTVWDRIEWPTVRGVAAVDTVYRINPDRDNQEKIKG